MYQILVRYVRFGHWKVGHKIVAGVMLCAKYAAHSFANNDDFRSWAHDFIQRYDENRALYGKHRQEARPEPNRMLARHKKEPALVS
jgi:hypothetical protein